MQTLNGVGLVFKNDDTRTEPPAVRTKFNVSMEKKIEKLLQDSEQQGWDYARFVSTVMEVLTVIHHRNKIRCAEPAPKMGRQTKHALS